MKIVRIDEGFQRWDELLALILSSFAYMNDRIDPPSSALKLTLPSLADRARLEIVYAATEGEVLRGCVFLRPEDDCLYIGKLAISPDAQGRGIGRRLLAVAEEVARSRALASLRLETRIELVENHRVFVRWGFEKTAENAHPGFTRTTSIEMRKPVSV
ncbi:GNAT superfamily N-acetyltransferase [Rhizobium tibeticum]|uniref:Acetyltransferase (GNAT) family protein n=1 Tax=Rhizobium tibeticum TaxID=501024 RepID=A0A1H8K3T6_9HYPH|nr:GNAT family N-acetyltransferase [Rhizobium tibeticum]MDP9812753.1 GNAT superfamily N-acetyltransferase [Rhizobium tibeticum]SEH77590.1 TDP-fucosamine acetyltransferase [Rhizobium tibeticum]SEN87485.1 Acetyltransferase (GNAT) family protein [Rhizobium tibeticum]